MELRRLGGRKEVGLMEGWKVGTGREEGRDREDGRKGVGKEVRRKGEKEGVKKIVKKNIKDCDDLMDSFDNQKQDAFEHYCTSIKFSAHNKISYITLHCYIVQCSYNFKCCTLDPEHHRSLPLGGSRTVNISPDHYRTAHVFVLQESARLGRSWNPRYDVPVVHYTESIVHELIEFLKYVQNSTLNSRIM